MLLAKYVATKENYGWWNEMKANKIINFIGNERRIAVLSVD